MRRLLIVSILFTTACASAPSPAPAPAVEVPTAYIGPHGFNVAGMDTSVKACDNFYDFATGNWRKSNPLPSTSARFGSFEQVAERNRDTLRAILEDAAKTNAEPGTATQKMGDFYRSCMDEAGIEARGLAPIEADLARINAISDRRGVVAEIQRMQMRQVPSFGIEPRGGNPLFGFGIQNDFKKSDQVIAVVGQGGLGLPDRDYYLRDDDQFRNARSAYVQHIASMFRLAGVDVAQAAGDAQRVLELETELARASMTRIDSRKPENVYHITPVGELAAANPSLDWPAFFASMGLSDMATINVAQPEFLAAANRLIDTASIETWKAYLRWNLIDTAAPALPSAFVNADFEFRSRTLSGQKELKPRWQRCVQLADVSMGALLGQEYVKRNFTPEAKRKMEELIGNLIAALREDIPTLTWMGPETKREAIAKLDAFKSRIGYPNAWRDYSTLTINNDFAQNVFAVREHAARRVASRVGKLDDPNEWGAFTPATVNASYNAARNFITFPAGILQPPFYDPNADDAYNYGGIGSVIGHEMSHGFDDRGAKFDATGNLRNWWTDADLKNFNARAECIANQYSEFEVEKGLNIQGKLVTGEAIGDLGGVMLAYRAYQKSREGKPATMVDGFSPDQRFFLGFAQVWAENMAIEEQRRRALTDPHAQGPFRVNATVSNMPEFHRAFSCTNGTAMVREAAKRCAIW